MLSEEQVQALRANLVEEVNKCRAEQDWERLGSMAEALKKVSAPDFAVSEEKLSEVRSLTGDELVDKALAISPATARTTEILVDPPISTSPGAISGIPTHHLHEPPPSTNGAHDHGQETPVTPLSAPSASPSTKPDMVAVEDPQKEIRIQELLQELREIRNQEPQTPKEITTYIRRLGAKRKELMDELGEFATRSQEVARAGEALSLLEELQGTNEQIHKLTSSVKAALAALHLRQARESKQSAETLVTRLGDERFKRDFSTITEILLAEAQTLVNDAEVARQHISHETGQFLTRRMDDDRQRLIEQLDLLHEQNRIGRPYVPVDKKDLEIGGWSEPEIRTSDAIAAKEGRLLEVCRIEAARLLEEARRLTSSDLEAAEKRCNEGLTFAQSLHVANSPELRTLAEQLIHQLAEIGQLKRLQEQAQEWHKRARDTLDAAAALNSLTEAERLFPGLEGVAELYQTRLDDLKREVNQRVRQSVDMARSLATDRDYVAAERELFDAQAFIAALPSYKDLDREPWNTELNEALTEIREERTAWQRFNLRLRTTRQGRPHITNGRLDEGWLSSLEQQLGEVDLKRFENEWLDWKAEMVSRAGDQAVYEEALQRYQGNPRDATVATLLGGITDTSPVYTQAQVLLRRHLAQCGLDKIRRALTSNALIQDPTTWYQSVYDAVEVTRTNAVAPEDSALADEAKDLQSLAERLRNLQASTADSIAAGNFQQAWQLLQDQQPDDEHEQYLQMCLNLVRLNLRKQWRARRMAFINDQVLTGDPPDYARRSTATRSQLRQAVSYIDELTRHAALTEDGDDLRATAVQRFAHEVDIESILGVSLDKVDENTFANLLKQGTVDWAGLWEHFNALSKPGLNRNAEKWRGTALGYYALTQSRLQALEDLEARRQDPRLRADPVICAVRCLLLLDNEQVNEVNALIAELKTLGYAAQQLAEGLTAIRDAYEQHLQHNLDMASATISSGVAILLELMPGFAPGLQEAITKRKRLWERTMGDSLVQQVSAELTSASGLTLFDLEQKLQRAQEYLGTDARVTNLRGQLKPYLEQALENLQQALEDILNQPPQDLEAAIRDAEKLTKYAERSTGVAALGGNLPREQILSEIRRDYRELQGLLADWKAVQHLLKQARAKLVAVLQDNWVWNLTPETPPNRELGEANNLLRQARSKLNGDYTPQQIRQLERLVRDLRAAVVEISQVFETFRQDFSADNYRNNDDFETARAHLDDLDSKIDRWQNTLVDNQRLVILEVDDLAISLRRHFRVQNPYRRTIRDGNRWVEEGAIGELRSIEEARSNLRRRKANTQNWNSWVQRCAEEIGKLRNELSQAQRALSTRRLGDATRICEQQVPTTLASLAQLRDNIHEPPLCALALQHARDTSALLVDEAYDDENLGGSLQELARKSRLEIPVAWLEYLNFEINAGTAEHNQLRQKCTTKKADLRRLCEAMRLHCRQVPANHATIRSQCQFWTFLQDAELIDIENTDVIGYRGQFQTRNRRLKIEEGEMDSLCRR